MSFRYLFLCVTSIVQCTAMYERDRHIVNHHLRTGILYYPNDIQGMMATKLYKTQDLSNKPDERVIIQFYYEALCPASKAFFTGEFKKTTDALSPYLNIYLYPYGNAETMIQKNGRVEFTCHHGQRECYGNKLHACAIDKLYNITEAIFYISCMMDNGSDDAAADKCPRRDSVGPYERQLYDPELIKYCANGRRGNTLVRFYGEETKRANVYHVPYILVNGVKSNENSFMDDVCDAIKNPPAACYSGSMEEVVFLN